MLHDLPLGIHSILADHTQINFDINEYTEEVLKYQEKENNLLDEFNQSLKNIDIENELNKKS